MKLSDYLLKNEADTVPKGEDCMKLFDYLLKNEADSVPKGDTI